MTTNDETRPTVAVADLHGHPEHLDALLDRLDEVLGDDYALVTLGDYVDNGPDIPGLLDRLIELRSSRGDRFHAILGNHDLACLRTLGWPGSEPDPRWYGHWSRRYWEPGLGTAAAYGASDAASLARKMPRAHVEFLASLPWYHEAGEYFFVHAGLQPGAIGPQRARLQRRELPKEHEYSPPELRDKGLSVAHDPSWDRIVVSGHTKQPAARAEGGHPHAPHFIAERRICLSGEIDRTERLFAIILPERRLIEVGKDLSVTIAPARPTDDTAAPTTRRRPPVPVAPLGMPSSPAAGEPAQADDVVSRARTRVLAAGGRVVADREARGRVVLKLPKSQAALADEVAALVGARVETGAHYLVVVCPASPRAEVTEAGAISAPAPPPAEAPPDRGHLAALTEAVPAARRRLLVYRDQDLHAARALVERMEASVRADPAGVFEFTSEGAAILVTPTQRYSAGRFATPTIAALKAEARSRAASPAKRTPTRLSLLRGTDPLFDIGTLQAGADDGTVFQVASQFNCLEAPGPRLVPVASYFTDPTQGPRASISAFPGTLLRHYAAPGDGRRFTQADGGPQLDLLRDALDPNVGQVHNGYLSSHGVRQPARLAETLDRQLDQIRVGVHSDVEVVFGVNWGGPVPEPRPRIAQVFTSTLALGGYSTKTDGLADACRPLLRAAYLGTLLAACGLGARRVVLTLIGGGAFGNPMHTIWEAVRWALAEVDGLGLAATPDVVLNARDGLTGDLLEEAIAEVGHRKGAVVESSQGRLVLR